MRVWAFIPARGGSKSIPLKNLAILNGKPLIDYSISAAKTWNRFERIICSTEDLRIAERARNHGIEVDHRPLSLCADDTPIADVVCEFLERSVNKPEWLALIQPTSPFLLPEHITSLLNAVAQELEANSGQTVTPCAHNAHAWNQRILENGYVRFKFEEERRTAFNKQRKPKFHVFGNLIVARVSALEKKLGFFAQPSVAVEISVPYNHDADNALDFAIAELMISGGLVNLTSQERNPGDSA